MRSRGGWSARDKRRLVSVVAVRALVALSFLACGRIRFDPLSGDAPLAPPMVKIVPADAAAGFRIGQSVAVDGGLVVIGADSADGGRGRTYAYRLGVQGWQLDGTLLAGDGMPMDRLGGFVGVFGDRIASSADGADDFGMSSGAAYLFGHDGSIWGELAKLTTSDAIDYAYLGQTLAMDRDHVIVGCRYCDQLGTDAGAAYVWTAADTQTPPTVLVAGVAGDQFGVYVSISGTVAAVSRTADLTQGVIHVFRDTGSIWTQEQVLVSSDGVTPDEFGIGLDVDGDVVLAGAFNKDLATGAAYVFRYDGTRWSEEQKLIASDAAVGAWFGRNVAVSGDMAVVGSPNWSGDVGAAYVYRFDGARWNEITKLQADVPTPGNRYGYSVSISGAIVVIGCPYDDDAGTDAGAVYVYNLDL